VLLIVTGVVTVSVTGTVTSIYSVLVRAVNAGTVARASEEIVVFALSGVVADWTGHGGLALMQ
jgi:hypothetical protein